MTAVLFISLIVLLIIGVPIAFVLCGSSILAILVSGDIHSAIVIQRMFSGCGSFTLLAIPFFVLAGNLMSAGGISKRLVNLCNSLFGHISGGLAMVAIITCAFFAAISGSSAATAAAVGTIIIPEMLNHKYDRNFAAATVASSAELGVIIPPSIGLIQYGVATGTSISDLFMAGFLPGIFICLVLCVVAHFMCKKQGFEASEKASGKERWQAFKDAILAILMPVIILGGIYSGLFTPTEAAVVAVFYGLFVGLFVYKEIKFSDIPKILTDSAMTMATVLLIMSASHYFWMDSDKTADSSGSSRRLLKYICKQICFPSVGQCIAADYRYVLRSRCSHGYSGTAFGPGGSDIGHRPGSLWCHYDGQPGNRYDDPSSWRQPLCCL